MDPRWQNLPHTHTEFAPATYPDRENLGTRKGETQKANPLCRWTLANARKAPARHPHLRPH